MIWFLIWFLIAILCGSIGKDRECGAFYGFGWGLLCPPIGLIYVALSKKKKNIAELLKEAEIYYSNKIITERAYNKMKEDILKGKVKKLQYYQDIDIYNPFNK